ILSGFGLIQCVTFLPEGRRQDFVRKNSQQKPLVLFIHRSHRVSVAGGEMRMYVWLCVATLVGNLLHESAAGPASSHDDGLVYKINTPPHIYEPDPDHVKELYPSASTPLYVPCQAHGSQPISYRWLFIGENSSSVVESTDHVSFDRVNGTLHMPSGVSIREEGDFQCLATNEYGTSVSQIVTIRAKQEPEFPELAPKTKRVTEGKGITIECEGKPTFVPDGFYHWYRIPTDPDEKSEQITASERMSVDANGTLYITSASTDDHDRHRYYACGVQARDKRTIRTGGKVDLRVESSQSGQDAPKLLGSTGYLKGDIGSEALLECFFSGTPPPTIKWKDVRDRVITGMEDRYEFAEGEHRRKLKITRLVEDDEGTFWCEAENVMGTARSSVYVNVTSPPIFESRPVHVIAPRGSDAMFTCRARPALREQNLPPPIWFYNAAIKSEFEFTPDKTRLTFRNVNHDDVASVQCNVTNEREPLVITEQPNATIDTELGDKSVNLTISATADTCCPLKFSWYLDGRDLKATALEKPPYSYQRDDNTVTLTISLMGETAGQVYGRYRCYGSAPSLWWLAIVCGVVVLVIAGILVFLMIHYNYPRQEYLLEKEERKHQLNPERDLLDQSFIEI
ncbi:hypothetical protein BaRGS_00033126, partial [Batillaria attramentaria]